MPVRRQKKVVSLRGAAIPLPQRNPEVVGALEELLAEAKDGNIAGLIVGKISPQGHILHAWFGNADRHAMIAAAASLQYRIVRAGNDE